METIDTNVAALRQQIIDCASSRREAYREINGFLPYRGELDLMSIASDTNYDAQDREAAISLLETMYAERGRIIAGLPPLEIGDQPTGVTIGERFVNILEINELGSLDLARSSHEGGNWDAANTMQDQLDDLVASLSLGYDIETFHRSPTTCSMYISVFAPEFLSAGLVCFTRNSHKVTLYNPQNDEDIRINKRSEFVIDLYALGPVLRATILDKIKHHVSENSFMIQEDFDLFNGLVLDRHPALKPIYSTMYAYRQPVAREKELRQPTILEAYPELKAAWESYHRPKELTQAGQ